MRNVLRAGTRASALARAQTAIVLHQLRTVTQQAIEVVPITTHGDRDQHTPLHAIGGQGVFVRALHEALLEGAIDFAVHSAKDLPTDLPSGIALAAVLIRDDPRDAVITRSGQPLAALPPGARIGTSSSRRMALLRHHLPHLTPVPLRGNVDTRLRKLDTGEVDAVILAAAGLHRLGLLDRIVTALPPEDFIPAPGQGALAVTCRMDDAALQSLLRTLDDPATRTAVEAERAFLRALGSGCSLPAGAYATVEGEMVQIVAFLASPEGDRLVRASRRVPVAEATTAATALAIALAERLGQPLEARHAP